MLHFAVAKTNDWERDLAANSGGLAYLMEHHQRARAFLHCSSTAVYKPDGHRVFDEDGPLGDNHGVWPFLRTYSICKIAAEATARWGAERFGLPTTIARLSVPYGDNGGWPAIHLHMMLSGHAVPVHVDAPSVYHPLHADDILAMVPRLLGVASVPAVTVNWGGSEPVSIEEWCTYLAELAGTEARFEPTEHTIDSVQIDTTRMHELVGADDGPLARGHAAHGQGAAPRPGGVSAEPGGPRPRSASSCCDPEEPPASELLAAMRAELNDAYATPSRLDNPPLTPAELRPPGGAYLVGYEGEEAVAGGGLRRLGDGVAGDQAHVRPPRRPLAGRGRGAPGGARGARRGRSATRRSASTPGPSRCTRSASTVRRATWTCRPTTTTRSPASGGRSGWRELWHGGGGCEGRRGQRRPVAASETIGGCDRPSASDRTAAGSEGPDLDHLARLGHGARSPRRWRGRPRCRRR